MYLTAAAKSPSLRKPTKSEDLTWNTAVEWVMREQKLLTPVELTDMTAWLKADPAHLAAYEEASYVWMLTEVAMQKK